MKKKWLLFLLVLFIGFAFFLFLKAHPLFEIPPIRKLGFGGKTFKVKYVIDGDTIVLTDGRHVRYLGINAPEIRHEGVSGSRESKAGSGNTDECFGPEAKKINEQLVLGKEVKLEFEGNEFDRYGRTLAWVFVRDSSDSLDLSDPFDSLLSVDLEIARRGAARYFWTKVPTRFTKEIIAAAEKARKEKVGLWGRCGKINGECSIKGNLDRNGRKYYHLPAQAGLPGSKYYDVTQVNLDHGDKWFCSELEASASGFKKSP